MSDKDQRKSDTESASTEGAPSPKSAKAVRAQKSKNKKNRKKIGSYRPYPRVPLEKALSVATAIKEKNGGNPWPAAQVAAAVGLSPKNVDFYYLLASSQKYGLTTGTKPDGDVALTPLGREAVYSGSPEEELEAKRKAVLSVDVFKKVLQHYNGNRLPEMQYLGNTLQDKFELPAEFHEEFSKLFRQTCDYVGWKEGLELGAPEQPKQENRAGRTSKDVIVLGEPKKKTGLTCFVIMPFKERTDGFMPGFFEEVLNSLIIPAVTDAGFEVKTANRQGTDIIHSTIISEVLNADMCVCDLTEHNPNVLFELGMRLANEKPVALIHAEGTQRVFDVDNILRVLAYKKAAMANHCRTRPPRADCSYQSNMGEPRQPRNIRKCPTEGTGQAIAGGNRWLGGGQNQGRDVSRTFWPVQGSRRRRSFSFPTRPLALRHVAYASAWTMMSTS